MMVAGTSVQGGAEHATNIPAGGCYLHIKGQFHPGVVIEQWERNAGLLYDRLTFSIVHPKTTTSGNLAISNYQMNVAGNREYGSGDEVILYIDGVASWTGYIVARRTILNADAVQYAAVDCRWQLRDIIAGTLVLDADALSGDPIFTHWRMKFNENSLSNKYKDALSFTPVPNYFESVDGPTHIGGGVEFARPWDGISIVQYLFFLRNKQATYYGYTGIKNVNGNGTGLFTYFDGTGLITETSLTQWPQLIYPASSRLGDIDNYDPWGKTFLEAIHTILEMHGLTMATGYMGELQIVDLSPRKLIGKELSASLGAGGSMDGMVTDINWENAYGAAGNVPLPTALEVTTHLEAAWTGYEETQFWVTYNTRNTADGGGSDFNFNAWRAACDAHPKVYNSYRLRSADGTFSGFQAPNKAKILPHLSRDNGFDEPLKAMQIFVENKATAQWVKYTAEEAGVYVDETNHLIHLPGLRYIALTFNKAGTLAPVGSGYNKVYATLAFEASTGQNVNSLYGSGTTATENPQITDDLESNNPNGISSQILTEYFEDPPYAMAFNISSKRRFESDESYFASHDGRSTFDSGQTKESIVYKHLDNENARSAERILRATQPVRDGSMGMAKPELSLKVGDTVSVNVSFADTLDRKEQSIFIVRQIVHVFPGLAGDGDRDWPSRTDVKLAF